MIDSIYEEDLNYIFNGLSRIELDKFENSNLLITGCAGFLGYYIVNFLASFKKKLRINRIIGLDNFISGHPNWLKKISNENLIELYNFNIIKDDISSIRDSEKVNFVIHMASIASPTFYRIHPLETIDANIWGLRSLLDFYSNKKIKGFLFFSSSEIYGNPDPKFIPTSEDYPGLVSPQGPRACYDEAKRFGETLAYVFNQKHNIPISIVRPFNNYGPGMKINDARAPADFAKAIINSQDILIHSNGYPTRTFCYVSDAIIGYFKALLYGKFETFNIGNPDPEINVLQLAKIYQEHGKNIFSYTGKIVFEESKDPNYLTNNPQRRCPSIKKAINLLDYSPKVRVNEGIKRFLLFLKQSNLEDLSW